MVGPTPGELCRTQAPTTAGSGDLQPKFDEEVRAPLWCKMSVLPSFILGSATSLGECQDQVPGDPPAALGDLARHRASNFPIALSRQSLLTTCDDSPLNAKHCPAAPSSNPGSLPTMRHQLLTSLAATNQQRFGTHVSLRFDALDDSERDGYDTPGKCHSHTRACIPAGLVP